MVYLDMTTLIFDIEADGLLEDVSKIHCIVWKDLESSKVYKAIDSYCGFIYGLDTLTEEDTIVGHNIIGYDIPLLHKLYNIDYPKCKIVDTLIWSKLFFPNLQSPTGWEGKPRPHSLEAWAMRMGGQQKIQHEDWSTYSPEMLERCRADVQITEKLYNKLKVYYEEDY